ncbi:Protein of uncharacterised function (DUF1040) [Mannheimia haemolytica]|uniref:Protein of uncharacterized function (DUF1040) n=1 Tax=Mannheimia haemolytica TaxID=75985 RepID=A0A378MY05_MANHA|nr:Protein of uncharacterised function (DUF1040) [Mannheimia haemolytica]
MKCERLEELLELLGEHWRKNPDLHLIDILQQLSVEVGEPDNFKALSDEVLIYQLKMRNAGKFEPIPGIKKIMKMILKRLYCELVEF